MKKIRIGKDIHITWEILTNGEPQSLDGRDLKLVLTNPLRAREDMEFSVDGNRISCKFPGVKQKHLGVYMLTLWENFGQTGQTAVDACKAFQLVPYTCMEGDEDNGLDTETVDLGTSGMDLNPVYGIYSEKVRYIETMTQDEYESIEEKKDDTLYIILYGTE